MNTDILQLASEAYTLAYKLNANDRTDGEPCRAAFRTARAILSIACPESADYIEAAVIGSDEYSTADIKRFLKNALGE